MFSTFFKQQYSRPTLVADWHRNREDEPKDYDITMCPDGKKNLSKSTYKHFGTSLDADWTTTTQSQIGQCLLKKEFEPRETPKSMLEADHFQSAVFDRRSLIREMGQLTDVGNSILPRYKPGHNQMEWDTTYGVDYLSARDYGMEPARTIAVQRETNPDFRKRLSQFTDIAGHRRVGRNKFQDESGVYATLGNRTSINTKITNPICP